MLTKWIVAYITDDEFAVFKFNLKNYVMDFQTMKNKIKITSEFITIGIMFDFRSNEPRIVSHILCK